MKIEQLILLAFGTVSSSVLPTWEQAVESNDELAIAKNYDDADMTVNQVHDGDTLWCTGTVKSVALYRTVVKLCY